MKERTLSIIKPDGVSRNLVGTIISRLEEKGLGIAAMKMIKMSKEQAKGFYKVHAGKPFYESVTDFMSSGPCVVMVLEGNDVIGRYRKLMGATNYKEAEEYLNRALYEYNHAMVTDNNGLGWVYGGLGTLYTRLGENTKSEE